MPLKPLARHTMVAIIVCEFLVTVITMCLGHETLFHISVAINWQFPSLKRKSRSPKDRAKRSPFKVTLPPLCKCIRVRQAHMLWPCFIRPI